VIFNLRKNNINDKDALFHTLKADSFGYSGAIKELKFFSARDTSPAKIQLQGNVQVAEYIREFSKWTNKRPLSGLARFKLRIEPFVDEVFALQKGQSESFSNLLVNKFLNLTSNRSEPNNGGICKFRLTMKNSSHPNCGEVFNELLISPDQPSVPVYSYWLTFKPGEEPNIAETSFINVREIIRRSYVDRMATYRANNGYLPMGKAIEEIRMIMDNEIDETQSEAYPETKFSSLDEAIKRTNLTFGMVYFIRELPNQFITESKLYKNIDIAHCLEAISRIFPKGKHSYSLPPPSDKTLYLAGYGIIPNPVAQHPQVLARYIASLDVNAEHIQETYGIFSYLFDADSEVKPKGEIQISYLETLKKMHCLYNSLHQKTQGKEIYNNFWIRAMTIADPKGKYSITTEANNRKIFEEHLEADEISKQIMKRYKCINEKTNIDASSLVMQQEIEDKEDDTAIENFLKNRNRIAKTIKRNNSIEINTLKGQGITIGTAMAEEKYEALILKIKEEVSELRDYEIGDVAKQGLYLGPLQQQMQEVQHKSDARKEMCSFTSKLNKIKYADSTGPTHTDILCDVAEKIGKGGKLSTTLIRERNRNESEYYREKQHYTPAYKDLIKNKWTEYRDNEKEIVTRGLVETLDEFIDGQGLEQAEGMFRKTDLSDEQRNHLKETDLETTTKQTNIAMALLNQKIPDMSLNKRTTERAIIDGNYKTRMMQKKFEIANNRKERMIANKRIDTGQNNQRQYNLRNDNQDRTNQGNTRGRKVRGAPAGFTRGNSGRGRGGSANGVRVDEPQYQDVRLDGQRDNYYTNNGARAKDNRNRGPRQDNQTTSSTPRYRGEGGSGYHHSLTLPGQDWNDHPYDDRH